LWLPPGISPSEFILSAGDIAAVFVSETWLTRPPEPWLHPPVPLLRYEASNITSLGIEASAYVSLGRAFLAVRMDPPVPCDLYCGRRLGILRLLRFDKDGSDLLLSLL